MKNREPIPSRIVADMIADAEDIRANAAVSIRLKMRDHPVIAGPFVKAAMSYMLAPIRIHARRCGRYVSAGDRAVAILGDLHGTFVERIKEWTYPLADIGTADIVVRFTETDTDVLTLIDQLQADIANTPDAESDVDLFVALDLPLLTERRKFISPPTALWKSLDTIRRGVLGAVHNFVSIRTNSIDANWGTIHQSILDFRTKVVAPFLGSLDVDVKMVAQSAYDFLTEMLNITQYNRRFRCEDDAGIAHVGFYPSYEEPVIAIQAIGTPRFTSIHRARLFPDVNDGDEVDLKYLRANSS